MVPLFFSSDPLLLAPLSVRLDGISPRVSQWFTIKIMLQTYFSSFSPLVFKRREKSPPGDKWLESFLVHHLLSLSLCVCVCVCLGIYFHTVSSLISLYFWGVTPIRSGSCPNPRRPERMGSAVRQQVPAAEGGVKSWFVPASVRDLITAPTPNT